MEGYYYIRYGKQLLTKPAYCSIDMYLSVSYTIVAFPVSV